MGKRAQMWDGGAWFRGTFALGLALSGACGARNQLPGGLAIDDDTSSGGGQNSSGPNTTSTVVSVSNISTTAANSSFVSGIGVSSVSGVSGVSTTGITPASGFSGIATGVGAAPSCPTDSTGGGGMDSAAGAGGEAGVPNEPTQCPLPYCNGWVNKDGNCANIQGTFFTYSDQLDGGSSTISASSSTDRFCVSGQVNKVLNGQYDVYWGAGFGLTLNQPGFNYPGEPYNAEEEAVVGFGFSVDALPIGELRFMVRTANDDIYCETVFTQGYSEYRLADLIKGCWDPMSTPHDYSSLMSIEWHFVSNAATPYTFGLCLTDLTVYREPSE